LAEGQEEGEGRENPTGSLNQIPPWLQVLREILRVTRVNLKLEGVGKEEAVEVAKEEVEH
jgi:hypothetical protein